MKKYTEVLTSQMLSGALEHFRIDTPESIEITNDKETETEYYFQQADVLETIVEIFRMYGNVVIVGPVDADGVSIAVEKADAIDVADVQARIQALGTVPFGERDTGTTDGGGNPIYDYDVDLSGVTVNKVDYVLA